MSLIEKVRKNGLVGSSRIATGMVKRRLRRQIDAWRFRDAPKYSNPTESELAQVESDLTGLSIAVADYAPPDRFRRFQQEAWFPEDYHGGRAMGVWDEKLLEHWIAGELLYDARRLTERVLNPIQQAGLSYLLYALRNKAALGTGGGGPQKLDNVLS